VAGAPFGNISASVPVFNAATETLPL
jgi:hypothetical protein